MINLCCYLAENYEDEFITATGDSCLTFSSQISAIKTNSITSDVDLSIYQ